MSELLDAAAVRRWCIAAVSGLTAARQEIDDLNVYPVPDGDTGTNLVHTMRAAAAAVDAEPDTDPPTEQAGPLLHRMARGALLGARGNSGVIVSQLLRGAADALSTVTVARGRELAAALTRASEAAYASVAEPVEGTVLSVARAAAEAARQAGDDLAAVVTAAAAGAAQALARTPEQLPALARAGVVDAGGRGLVVLLDALASVLTDGEVPEPPAATELPSATFPAPHDGASSDYDYEVQYLLDADDEAAAVLRTELAPLGDSLLIAGTGDGLWNVHVHVNDAGAAVEAGVRAGRPHRITITRFADQSGAAPRHTQRAVVAVADGDGLMKVFRDEGAEVVLGGPGRAPSTSDLLMAIRRTRSGQVVLLPNDGNTHAAATAAAQEARAEGRTVAMLPTRSPVQGLAAMAVRDLERRFADDVIAMAEAMGATRCGAVTVAVRDSLTSAGECTTGDVLGLIEGDVQIVGSDLIAVSCGLVDRLLTSGGEMVTIVVGDGAGPDLGERVQHHLREHWPAVETVRYHGDQPHYPLLLGVE